MFFEWAIIEVYKVYLQIHGLGSDVPQNPLYCQASTRFNLTPKTFHDSTFFFFLFLLSFSFFPFVSSILKPISSPTLVHFTWINSYLSPLFLHLHWSCQYHLIYQSVILTVACTFSPLQLNWKLPEDREKKQTNKHWVCINSCSSVD